MPTYRPLYVSYFKIRAMAKHSKLWLKLKLKLKPQPVRVEVRS